MRKFSTNPLAFIKWQWTDWTRQRQASSEISTQIIAHRGSKSNRPENTLAAYAEAIRVGTDGIELDVHLSKDGQLVVIHDEKIDRTTNGTGYVRDYTLAQLQTFSASKQFPDTFPDEKISTLTEVLAFLCQKSFAGKLIIEIKTDNFHYPDIEKKLSKTMCSQVWPFDYAYCSFNFKSLLTIHKLEPDRELCYLTYNRPKEVTRGLLHPAIDTIHPKRSWLFAHTRALPLVKKPVRAWTINSQREIVNALKLNIAGIITDCPEKALRLREKLNRAGNSHQK